MRVLSEGRSRPSREDVRLFVGTVIVLAGSLIVFAGVVLAVILWLT
jgi:hypothetical protein